MLPVETIKEVIISQRKWLIESDIGVTREKLKEIILDESFALLITGVRRCGKSTLLNQLTKKQKKWYYLNLEDPRLNGFELSDFNKVELLMKEMYGERGVYFFDEIQTVSLWEKFIRFLVDKKDKVVITGSNASLLSRELGTKLTGRHLQIELFPFSFTEFTSIKEEKPSLMLFEEYLIKGGFPEYIKKENSTILNELLSDIIIKDIAVRFNIKNTNVLTKIAIYLLSNVGKEFSFNSIKQTFQVKSVQSVIDYISYFENSYMFFTVPKFSYSYKQQQVNPKKIYVIDNGFSYVNTASFSKDKGKMLENIVFLHLRRKYKEIFYFKKNNECDFIIKDKEKTVLALQVCYDLNQDNLNRELNGIIEAITELGLKEGLILTLNQEDEFKKDGYLIKVVPVWKWLLK